MDSWPRLGCSEQTQAPPTWFTNGPILYGSGKLPLHVLCKHALLHSAPDRSCPSNELPSRVRSLPEKFGMASLESQWSRLAAPFSSNPCFLSPPVPSCRDGTRPDPACAAQKSISIEMDDGAL